MFGFGDGVTGLGLLVCCVSLFCFMFKHSINTTKKKQFEIKCAQQWHYLGVTGTALGDGVTGGMLTLGEGVTGLGLLYFVLFCFF